MATYRDFRNIFARSGNNPSGVLPTTSYTLGTKTHFVDWCTGVSPNNRDWGFGGNGSETINMKADGINLQPATDDAYRPAYMSTGFTGTRTSSSDGTIRQYDPNGCTVIWVEKWLTTMTTEYQPNAFDGGFTERPSGDCAGENSAYWGSHRTYTDYKLRGISSGGQQTDTDSGFTKTSNDTCFKIEVTGSGGTSTKNEGSINGVVEGTQTTGNFSNAKMCISFGVQGYRSSGYTAHQRVIQYVEAWNN